MRRTCIAIVFVSALLVSTSAHAVLDCWPTFDGGTVCRVFSAAGRPPPLDDPADVCADAAWLFWDYCPVIEDSGDGTDAQFLLCEDAPFFVHTLCDSQ